MQYLRLADAKARLDRNLIQVNGEPFYVEFVDEPAVGTMLASGFKLADKRQTNVTLNQQYIPPPKFILGYTNLWKQKEPTAIYLERISARRTCLGLNRENSFATLVKPGADDGARRLEWTNVFLGQPFLDMQNGVYPPLKTALNFNSCALSSDYAVARSALKVYTLMYLNEAIGELYSDSMTLVLYPPYLYAAEEIGRFFKSKGEFVNVTVHK